MNRGDHLSEPIQERLRHQADRLLDAYGGEPPTPALLAELGRRRRRRRIATWAACSALAVLTAVGTAGVVRGLRPAQPTASHQGPIHLQDGAVEGAVARNNVDSQETGPSGSPRHASPNAATPDPRPTAHLNARILTQDGRLALPVLLAVPDGDKPKVIGAGLYVPPHTEQVSLLDLSPAEQHAVRQVLDIPEDTIPQGPI
jgi:hypothetical protein